MKRFICIILALSSSHGSAHEPEEMVTLRAANDALTLRVAQLLEENSRLQEFAEKALIAQSQGKAVSRGCDPQKLRRDLVESNNPTNALAISWLKKYGSSCSESELNYIDSQIESWSHYSMGQTRRLVQYYADQK